jgi:uncharacterized protein YllA (UPF0747 family)
MKKSYQKGKTLTEATRNLVQELFAEYGLLMIDGDDILLKNQMADIFSDELKIKLLIIFLKKTLNF